MGIGPSVPAYSATKYSRPSDISNSIIQTTVQSPPNSQPESSPESPLESTPESPLESTPELQPESPLESTPESQLLKSSGILSPDQELSGKLPQVTGFQSLQLSIQIFEGNNSSLIYILILIILLIIIFIIYYNLPSNNSDNLPYDIDNINNDLDYFYEGE